MEEKDSQVSGTGAWSAVIHKENMETTGFREKTVEWVRNGVWVARVPNNYLSTSLYQ